MNYIIRQYGRNVFVKDVSEEITFTTNINKSIIFSDEEAKNVITLLKLDYSLTEFVKESSNNLTRIYKIKTEINMKRKFNPEILLWLAVGCFSVSLICRILIIILY